MEGIKRILTRTGVKPLEKDIMALLARMMEADSFTSRLSALNLIPTLYTHVNPHNQTELIS